MVTVCLTPQYNENEAVQTRMIEAVHKIKTGIHVLYVNRDLSNHFLFPLQREELKALLAQGYTTHSHWND